jgi:hypothetical protein
VESIIALKGKEVGPHINETIKFICSADENE